MFYGCRDHRCSRAIAYADQRCFRATLPTRRHRHRNGQNLPETKIRIDRCCRLSRVSASPNSRTVPDLFDSQMSRIFHWSCFFFAHDHKARAATHSAKSGADHCRAALPPIAQNPRETYACAVTSHVLSTAGLRCQRHSATDILLKDNIHSPKLI